jgi:amidophosphoribosyltransferase
MCGVFGVYLNEEETLDFPKAATFAYFGIYALQHRGQESAGICSYYEDDIKRVANKGLVLEAISKEELKNLKGKVAISHVRYSTAGGDSAQNIQPIVRESKRFGKVAVVHNGNLTNYNFIRRLLVANEVELKCSSDTEVFLGLLDVVEKDTSINAHILDEELIPYLVSVLKLVEGAYSILMIINGKLIAARDPLGFRPLLMGRRQDAIVFASETCAFDIIEADYWREIKPGEITIVDENGIRTYFFAKSPKPKKCIFEHVYFARPDSFIFSEYSYNVRKKMGMELAKEDDITPDIVIPVPDSGMPAAIGYSQYKNIPYEMGLVRNHYIGRTFIAPTQDIRNLSVLMKLNPNKGIIKDKSIVVIDDSIVRGTTSKRIVNLLKEAGAKEVHMRIASPPVIGPCYYGIDTPTKEELMASHMSVEDIRRFIGADSLKYLSLEGLMRSVQEPDSFCDACFTDNYPVEVKL